MEEEVLLTYGNQFLQILFLSMVNAENASFVHSFSRAYFWSQILRNSIFVNVGKELIFVKEIQLLYYIFF